MTAFYCFQTVPITGFNFNWPIRALDLRRKTDNKQFLTRRLNLKYKLSSSGNGRECQIVIARNTSERLEALQWRKL